MDLKLDRQRAQAAIDLLEPHGAHPGTGALHDPLYLWLQDGEDAHLAALLRGLERQADHPAAPALRRLLDLGAPPAPDLRAILEADGPLREEDPLREVQRRLEQHRAFREASEERALALQEERRRLARHLDAMALVAALLAVLALAGWTGALGLWRVDWMEPPVPPADGGVPETKP